MPWRGWELYVSLVSFSTGATQCTSLCHGPGLALVVGYLPSSHRLRDMANCVGLGMDLPPESVLPSNGGRRRLPSFFDDQEPHAIQATSLGYNADGRRVCSLSYI